MHVRWPHFCHPSHPWRTSSCQWPMHTEVDYISRPYIIPEAMTRRTVRFQFYCGLSRQTISQRAAQVRGLHMPLSSGAGDLRLLLGWTRAMHFWITAHAHRRGRCQTMTISLDSFVWTADGCNQTHLYDMVILVLACVIASLVVIHNGALYGLPLLSHNRLVWCSDWHARSYSNRTADPHLAFTYAAAHPIGAPAVTFHYVPFSFATPRAPLPILHMIHGGGYLFGYFRSTARYYITWGHGAPARLVFYTRLTSWPCCSKAVHSSTPLWDMDTWLRHSLCIDVTCNHT